MTLRLIDAHAPQLLVDGRETDDKTELTTIALDMMAKVGKGDIRMFISEMARVYGTMSRPSWARGLKLLQFLVVEQHHLSHPFVGAWVETWFQRR